MDASARIEGVDVLRCRGWRGRRDRQRREHSGEAVVVLVRRRRRPPLSTTSSSPLLESSSRGGDGVTAGVKSGGVQPSSPARRAFQSFVFVAASRAFQRSRPQAALTSPRAAMALGDANGIS